MWFKQLHLIFLLSEHCHYYIRFLVWTFTLFKAVSQVINIFGLVMVVVCVYYIDDSEDIRMPEQAFL